MSNSYSYGKCWNFGKAVKADRNVPWKEFITHADWIAFKRKNNITDNQIYYIKRGYLGLSFKEETSSNLGDEIIPFGKFKGSRLSELSDNYILFLHKQEWLQKWPTVFLYVKQREQEINKDTDLDKDEIRNLLKIS